MNVSSAYKWGDSLGADVRVGVSGWLALQSELVYATRGAAILLQSGDPFYTYEMSYLNVPFLARAEVQMPGLTEVLERRPLKGYFLVGPTVSYLLGAKIEDDTGTDDLDKGILHSFDVGLAGGVGMLWELSPRWTTSFELRYEAGLTDVFPIDTDVEAKNRAIMLTFGVGYVLTNTDGDDDGIKNDIDRCPDRAEDRDGFEDQDGCPDEDDDRDGVSDEADACPGEREDRDGFEDEDGCLDPDNDEDGFLDEVDTCPDVPFSINDGCPPEYERVEVTGTRIKFKDGYSIEFERAGSELSEEHMRTLDEVTQVLADYPEMRLRIEGHADGEGSKAVNDGLSEERAKQVFLYLTQEMAIDGDRLEVVGHGERRPISYEADEKDKRKNRRVELVIIEGP